MSTVNKSNVGNSNTLYQKTLLRAFELKPVYRQFALAPTISGVDSSTFYRVNDLSARNRVPIVDAVHPTSEDVDIEQVKVLLAQYGSYIEYAASVEDIQPVDLIASFTKKIGKLGADVQEMIIQDELLTTVNIAYSNGGATADVVDLITVDDIYNIYENLESSGAEPISEIISAVDKTSTFPVDACYIMVATPAQAKTIKQLPGFEPRYKYANPNAAYIGEIGSLGSMRIISANILAEGILTGSGSATVTGRKATGGHCDVHRALAFGKEAFGVGVGSKGIQSVVTPPEKTGQALQLTGYTGYKMYYGAEILNPNWIACLQSAAAL